MRNEIKAFVMTVGVVVSVVFLVYALLLFREVIEGFFAKELVKDMIVFVCIGALVCYVGFIVYCHLLWMLRTRSEEDEI